MRYINLRLKLTLTLTWSSASVLIEPLSIARAEFRRIPQILNRGLNSLNAMIYDHISYVETWKIRAVLCTTYM